MNYMTTSNMDSSSSNIPPDDPSHHDLHPQTPPYTPLRPRSRKSLATSSALRGRKRQFARPSPSPASTTSTRSIHPAETSSPAKKAAQHRTPNAVHHSATKAAGRAENDLTNEGSSNAQLDGGESDWESEKDASPERGPAIRSSLRIRELVEGDAGYASDLEGNVVYPEGLEEVGSGSNDSGECSSDDQAEGKDGGMVDVERRGRVRSRLVKEEEDERLSVPDSTNDEDGDERSDDSNDAASDTGGVTNRLGRLRCSNGYEEAEAFFETRRRLRRLSRRMHHRQQHQESPSSPLSSEAPTSPARNGTNINNKRSHSQSLGAGATPAPSVPPVAPSRQEHSDAELPTTPSFPTFPAPPNAFAVFDAYEDDATDDMVVDSDAIDDQDFPTSQRRLRRRVRGPSASSSDDEAGNETQRRQGKQGMDGGQHMAASSAMASVRPTAKHGIFTPTAATAAAGASIPSSSPLEQREKGLDGDSGVGRARGFEGFAAPVPAYTSDDQRSDDHNHVIVQMEG
ncbi:hypothetical protein KC332_g5380 [Hortaea werneckii]|nr:hypothetical protein KC329_g8036 [Hortaea werneckii]KAI7261262.1 hypothetical protein KC335_g10825 [Hortaea werneckii]KAI7412251.1 hypothetical protein KC332_g5380 [Hortaea werneckii]KAI7424301.1 hypothetical protein KC336_g7290 [Hortaea werneckii]KAI7451756.1 hypothetical protein KC368_g3675 [Hortaea werneckii]